MKAGPRKMGFAKPTGCPQPRSEEPTAVWQVQLSAVGGSERVRTGSWVSTGALGGNTGKIPAWLGS